MLSSLPILIPNCIHTSMQYIQLRFNTPIVRVRGVMRRLFSIGVFGGFSMGSGGESGEGYYRRFDFR